MSKYIPKHLPKRMPSRRVISMVPSVSMMLSLGTFAVPTRADGVTPAADPSPADSHAR